MKNHDLHSIGRIFSTRFRVLITRSGRAPEEELTVYRARVGLRCIGEAAFASFDVSGNEPLRVRVEIAGPPIDSVHSRPSREEPVISIDSDTGFSFEVSKPQKLSLIINGDTLHTLHIFANVPVERNIAADDSNVRYFEPGIHVVPDDGFLRMESGDTLFLEDGAVLVSKGIVCDRVQDVLICGQGIVDLSPWRPVDAQDQKRPNTRGVDVRFSQRIRIEGITFLNPNHYTVYLGQSEDVSISNIKSFSSAMWADGVDCMSSKRVTVDDVFLRTSDDCIAIYGHRWEFYGDTSDVSATNSHLWADVAHPVLIGTHGFHEGEGDRIERITIRNIDVLLHDEVLEEYQGVIALNAGDNNTLEDMHFENIFVEEIRSGQIVNIRVFQNEAYNPKPGKRIERVRFKNLRYAGPEKKSLVAGFSPDRIVEGVIFEDCVFNGRKLTKPEVGSLVIGPHAGDVRFTGSA